MAAAVPNLYQNAGVLKYVGNRTEGRLTANNDVRSLPRCQDIEVRPCLPGSNVCEFKFKKELFNVIEVVKQINDNFIVAVALNQDDIALLLIDQHAIHERIRYEDLLKGYTVENQRLFTSTKLTIPMIIDDLPSHFSEQIAIHLKKIEAFGIGLNLENRDRLVVTSIPTCFDRIMLNHSRTELEHTVRKLLFEILDNLDCNYMPNANLPMVIHQAIATEACHGAIKFGEKLDIDQCTKLLQSWIHTKAPSRCAHGRPCVILLLKLKQSEIQMPILKTKLNFASLKRTCRPEKIISIHKRSKRNVDKSQSINFHHVIRSSNKLLPNSDSN
ncbi:DNA mismatch repair protein MutL-like [Neodiprion virginianus]|uniref:DNA mismatch repair protein MutL-like n=1 Tax=Neodiprion virginianus TaxID=2961670 RepID=UPI001EE6FC48|nr:DNA mismatch repair protein MutL-like [Neodiprion virginianus]